jgi:hypothetical protein
LVGPQKINGAHEKLMGLFKILTGKKMKEIISPKKILTFNLLGHRDYVHGPCMLEGMLASLSGFLGSNFVQPTIIKLFKIIKEFSTNAWAEPMKASDLADHPRLDKAAARLDIETGGSSYSVLLFDNPENPVKDRLISWNAAEYVERISVLGDGTAEASLRSTQNIIDLITGIVEAHRQIVITEPEYSKNIIKMRWGYITNFQIMGQNQVSQIKDICFKKSRSFIVKGNKRFVVRPFFLNKDHHENIVSEICFYQQLDS